MKHPHPEIFQMSRPTMDPLFVLSPQAALGRQLVLLVAGRAAGCFTAFTRERRGHGAARSARPGGALKVHLSRWDFLVWLKT